MIASQSEHRALGVGSEGYVWPHDFHRHGIADTIAELAGMSRNWLTFVWVKFCVWEERFCVGENISGGCSCVGPPFRHFRHKNYKHEEAAAREMNKVWEEKIKTLSRNTEPSSFRTTSMHHVKFCIAISVDITSTGNTCKDHMRSQICVKKKKRERTWWLTHSLRAKERKSPIN